ncbi:MAG: THUMP domain-containing class I SAM-dependent methyltransferase, partial [Nanoarchaeota archaeon]
RGSLTFSMHCFILVNPGLQNVAQQELKELVKSKATISGQALEFTIPGKEELIRLCARGQSFRRLLVFIDKFAALERLDADKVSFPWSDFFPLQFSFKIEVEGVPGQENRFQIAGEVAGKLFSCFQKNKFTPTLNVKKPDYTLIVYFTGKEYWVGLDCCEEIDSRSYRVFPHQATFKGDLAYYFVRQSGFKPKEKLLLGFVRDGGLAIEAALYANKLPVRERAKMPLQRFPSIAAEAAPQKLPPKQKMILS